MPSFSVMGLRDGAASSLGAGVPAAETFKGIAEDAKARPASSNRFRRVRVVSRLCARLFFLSSEVMRLPFNDFGDLTKRQRAQVKRMRHSRYAISWGNT